MSAGEDDVFVTVSESNTRWLNERGGIITEEEMASLSLSLSVVEER